VTPLIFLAGMLVIFWVLIVQPQRRRRQHQARLLANLAPGDEVLTTGGVYGSVREVGDGHVMLEIAPNTSVRVAKSAVAARLEPDREATEPPETSLP
jgi:preprotein translocase subunit YajC